MTLIFFFLCNYIVISRKGNLTFAVDFNFSSLISWQSCSTDTLVISLDLFFPSFFPHSCLVWYFYGWGGSIIVSIFFLSYLEALINFFVIVFPWVGEGLDVVKTFI